MKKICTDCKHAKACRFDGGARRCGIMGKKISDFGVYCTECVHYSGKNKASGCIDKGLKLS